VEKIVFALQVFSYHQELAYPQVRTATLYALVAHLHLLRRVRKFVVSVLIMLPMILQVILARVMQGTTILAQGIVRSALIIVQFAQVLYALHVQRMLRLILLASANATQDTFRVQTFASYAKLDVKPARVPLNALDV
jgi:hypothetical protein